MYSIYIIVSCVKNKNNYQNVTQINGETKQCIFNIRNKKKLSIIVSCKLYCVSYNIVFYHMYSIVLL